MSLLRLFLFVSISLVTILYSMSDALAVESGEDLERQVKAAYIFKFGNYVRWSEKSFLEASSPIIIGTVDDELMALELEKISSGYKVDNRPVVIKRLSSKDTNTEVHILYLNSASTAYVGVYQKTLQFPATLYVTDAVEGLNHGGIVNLIRDDNRIRFDVSLVAAEQNKIKLDASLLTVARHVLK